MFTFSEAVYASLSGTAQSPCVVYWTDGALRRNCRLKQHKTYFSPFLFFLFSQNSREWYLGFSSLASLDREGSAPWTTLPVPSC